MEYIYDAIETKLLKRSTIAGTTTERYYAGLFEYDGTEGLKLIHTDEGIVEVASGTFDYQYFLKDHLGNTRVTFNIDTALQLVDYYPFGMISFKDDNSVNDYLYNGKLERSGNPAPAGELQDELGMEWYDYGARFYDPQIGRWNVPDPMADLYPNLSPYNYSLNNPIRFIDPDGSIPWDALIRGRTYGARTGDNAFSSARKNPVDGVVRPHTGIDLGYTPSNGRLKGGEHICSAARGTVVKVGYNKAAGNYVVVDHGGGYQTVYCHIKDDGVLVVEGQKVNNGEYIAQVGSTGRSTGPHLHFGMKKDGEWINPTSIYDLDAELNPAPSNGDNNVYTSLLSTLINSSSEGEASELLNSMGVISTTGEVIISLDALMYYLYQKGIITQDEYNYYLDNGDLPATGNTDNIIDDDDLNDV